MPQLDPNTFTYQYVGIIILLIIVYSILSYIVLPILLRLMLIRNNFLTTRQTSTELVNIVSTNYQQLVSFKNPARSLNLLDKVINNSTLTLSAWLKLISVTLNNCNMLVNSKAAALTLSTLTTTCVIDYFILFLLIELDTNE